MEKEQIIEAIRNATDGTFLSGVYMTTCMGWQQYYDEQGRPLRADPNYKDSKITIAGETYPITKCGWYAYIWKPNSNANYLYLLRNDILNLDDYLFATIDLRPDYIKEYEEKKKTQSI